MNKWILITFVIRLIIPADFRVQAQPDFRAPRTHQLEISSQGEISRFSVLSRGSESIKPQMNHVYHWYDRGAIHSANCGIGGKLLHGKYQSYYAGSALHESGNYHKGQKTGKWLTWYPNGSISMISHWKNGLLHGVCVSYDTNVNNYTESHFRNGLLQGMQKTLEQGKCISKTKYHKGQKAEMPKNAKENKEERKRCCRIKSIFTKKKKPANE